MKTKICRGFSGRSGKRKMQRLSLVFGFVVVFCISSVEDAAARRVTSSSPILPALDYFWNFAPPHDRGGVPLSTTPQCVTRCGWVNGLLAGAQAYANHDAFFEYVGGSGTQIRDGELVPQGADLKVRPADTVITWIGTGTSSDSPYGYLVNNAGPTGVGCTSDNFVNRNSTFSPALGMTWPADVHMQLNVNPLFDAIDISHSGNLNCSMNESCLFGSWGGRCINDRKMRTWDCEAISEGPAWVELQYPSTYGRFYYRYNGPNGILLNSGFTGYGCHANNVPMRTSGSSSDYTVTFPEKTMRWDFTVGRANTPPSPPVINGATVGEPAPTAAPLANYNDIRYTFTATDPDGDPIRYGIDWLGWVPFPLEVLPDWFSFVSSGRSQTVDLPSTIPVWRTLGEHTFRVRAEDNKGGASDWVSHTINLTAVGAPVNGACNLATTSIPSGPAPLAAALCSAGTPSGIPVEDRTTMQWQWQCVGSGAGHTDANCSTAVAQYTLTVQKNGTGSGIVTADVGPIDCGITCSDTAVLHGDTRVLTAAPTSSTASWDGCDVPNGNICTVTVTANKTVTATFIPNPQDGVCGTANGGSFENLTSGSSDLCSGGSSSPVLRSGTNYSWTCAGQFGSGVDANCSATQYRNFNWREVSP